MYVSVYGNTLWACHVSTIYRRHKHGPCGDESWSVFVLICTCMYQVSTSTQPSGTLVTDWKREMEKWRWIWRKRHGRGVTLTPVRSLLIFRVTPRPGTIPGSFGTSKGGVSNVNLFQFWLHRRRPRRIPLSLSPPPFLLVWHSSSLGLWLMDRARISTHLPHPLFYTHVARFTFWI